MLTKTQIKGMFTHYGFIYGIVPIYVDISNDECPNIEVRNFVPAILLTICEEIYFAMIDLSNLMGANIEPVFAIKLTGKINDN